MEHGPLSRLPRSLCMLVLGLFCSGPHAQTLSPQTRGQMLYETHCITCHGLQMHWRNNKQARDWGSLNEQVRRWQAAESLQWTQDDVEAVARYLNDSIYRYPLPDPRVSLAPVSNFYLPARH